MKRREFLKSAACAGAFTIVPARLLKGATAPSNQITRALLGFGEIAHSFNHLNYKDSRLVALCDPDAKHVQNGIACAAKAGWGAIRACKDFRDILAMPDVDVVHICTPNNLHYEAAMFAMEHGCAVGLEKPLTMDVKQAEALVHRADRRVDLRIADAGIGLRAAVLHAIAAYEGDFRRLADAPPHAGGLQVLQREAGDVGGAGSQHTDLIILTHEAQEGAMNSATQRLQGLPAVLAPIVRLRKEELA